MNPQIKAIRSHLPRDSRHRSNVVAFTLLAICCSAWVLATATLLLSPWWLTGFATLAAGVTIAMLFIVGHDAAHDSLVPSHRMNRMIGTLVFLPALHPLSSWALSHNTKHHAWTNLKGEDPTYAPYSLAEYRSLPLYRRMLERLYRTSIGLGAFYLIEIYFKQMMFPGPKHRPANRRVFLFERLGVYAFLVVELAVAYAISIAINRQYPMLFAAYSVFAPFFVFVWLMGLVTFQHHTHPEIPWFENKTEWAFFQVQVAGTTHIRFPRIFDIAFLNILEHSAHHVDPLIPLYHLQSSQQALEIAYPGSIKVINWSPLVLWRTLSCCNLYDYRQHRWLDFAGIPTTPPLLTIKIAPENANIELQRTPELAST